MNNFDSIKIQNSDNKDNAYFLECEYSLKHNKYECINESKFDIYIFNENFGDERIHIFSKDKKTRYCIDINSQEIIDSSTDYNSFLMNEYLGENIINYLNENLENIKKTILKINS